LNIDPGYDAHNVLTARVFVYGDRYHDKPETELTYYELAMRRLRVTPGVESVAMASNMPLVTFDRARLPHPGSSSGKRRGSTVSGPLFGFARLL